MEESDPMASAMAIATVSGEVGRANDEGNGSTASESGGGGALIRQPSLVKHPSPPPSPSIPRTLSGKTLAEVWEYPITTNPTLASIGSGDGGANVGNFAGPWVGNGGMIPNMNSNGGYNGMASALAPELGQMGMQTWAGPTSLAPGANFPAQSPASDGMVSSHGNVLSLSPEDNNGVDGSKREEGKRADGPIDEVEERRQQRADRPIDDVEEQRQQRADGPIDEVEEQRQQRLIEVEERRQRRKISNRESSARSGEKKNKLIADLEAEVAGLKEENNRLNKKIEEMENK